MLGYSIRFQFFEKCPRHLKNKRLRHKPKPSEGDSAEPAVLLAQKFCWLIGAKRVIAVGYADYRLQHPKRTNHVEIVNFEQDKNIRNNLKEMTKGGADVVIDAVGMDGST
ncbi:hypothetical protein JOC55_002779 [Paenibacillus sacheonensis]|nr:hypothetical protein [Paenibacillus sacheonensis]